MDKPTKPTNLMPRSFGGVKNNWSYSMQSSGYEDGVPAIYGGDNLNYQLDATGKELDYCETICDFINNIPIGKTITVDNNNKLVYVNNIDFSSRHIGEIIQSIVPLTDAGVHLLDGALINGNGIYANFVDYIANLVSIYPNLFTTEATWQSTVTTYGVCGKFVYDSINNTVRLPKITGIVEGTTDLTALGDLVQAGLPNITGLFGVYDNTGGILNNFSGAFSGWTYKYGYGKATASNRQYDYWMGANFDASNSNSTYGNSTTVQPQTIKVLYYIVIATTSKTDIEVDIDEIATDLNGKAGTDLININDTARRTIAHVSSPSNTKTKDYTLGASGATYTMTADGILNLKVTGSNVGSFQMFNTSKPTSTYQVGGVVMGNGYWAAWAMPVSKGDIIQINYQLAPSAYGLTLIYATGAESEA